MTVPPAALTPVGSSLSDELGGGRASPPAPTPAPLSPAAAQQRRWAQLEAALVVLDTIDQQVLAPLGFGPPDQLRDTAHQLRADLDTLAGVDGTTLHGRSAAAAAPRAAGAPVPSGKPVGAAARPTPGAGTHAPLVTLATRSVAALEAVWMHPAAAPCCKAILRPLWMIFPVDQIAEALPAWVGVGLGPQTTADWAWLFTQVRHSPGFRLDGAQLRALFDAWLASPAATDPVLEADALRLVATDHLLVLQDLVPRVSLEGCGRLLTQMVRDTTPSDIAWAILAAPRLAHPAVPGSQALLERLAPVLDRDPLLGPRLRAVLAAPAPATLERATGPLASPAFGPAWAQTA